LRFIFTRQSFLQFGLISGLIGSLLLSKLALNLDQASAQDASPQLEQISHSTYFKLLLHYKKNIFGFERSEADGADFFIDPRGKYDPEAELRADIAAFNKPQAKSIGPLHQHPQCAFPERFRFIKEQFKEQLLDASFIEVPCPDFARWKSQFKPKSITLVYAAPYLGSPASMFGHSFLRIDTSKQALLDYGISFEAVTGPDPGVAYTLKGLTGFYPGIFSQMPYYLKVNTYINVDSRDLWEYELNLSESQIDHMLNHIWEMGTTYFNYYFFNKNCSYHLLSLIEVANPKLELRSQFGPMVIPIDSIRAITKYPEAIRSVQMRPSLLKTLKTNLKKMPAENLERFYELKQNIFRRTSAASTTLRTTEAAEVLDALLDWQKYESLNHAKTLADSSETISQQLLLARAKISSSPSQQNDPTSQEESSRTPLPPEQAHKTSQVTLGLGYDRSQTTMNFGFRPAIHDLLDPDDGYIAFSSLIIAQSDFSYLSNEQKLRLDQFKFAEVININPLTRLRKDWSWQIGARLFHPDDLNCSACVLSQVSAGIGLSLGSLQERVIFYSFLKGYGEYSDALFKDYHQSTRAAPVFEVGVLSQLSQRLKAWVSSEKLLYFPEIPNESFYHFKLALAYSNKEFELRLSSEEILKADSQALKALVSLGYFF